MDALFNMFKVKFVDLDALMSRHCTDLKSGSTVNLFINLDAVIKKLSSTNIDDYLKVKNHEKIYEMVANIINLAAHYRLFFTKSRIYSRVYMYVSGEYGNYYNAEIIPKYREHFTHKYTMDAKYVYLRSTLGESVDIAKTILEYVKDVYIISTKEIEPSITPRIISDEPTTGMNFLISTDRYEYQYVNKGFKIIRPKKTGSYMVTADNVIQILKEEDKIVNKQTVGPNFLPFILSVLGDKIRGLDNVKRVGLSATIKMINAAIDLNHISANTSSMTVLERLIKPESINMMRSNILCTDLDSQYMRLGMRSKYNISSQIVDKFDNASLKTINDKYFKLYPIRLVELMDANKLLKTNTKKSIFV